MTEEFTKYKNATDAIGHYMSRHSVAIWQEDQQEGIYIGSGTCIEIAGRFFIATAAHNFKDIPRGGRIILFSAVPSSDTPIDVIGQNYGDYGADDTIDVAWLEVDPKSAAKSNLNGVPLSIIAPYHTQQLKGVYEIAGFPAAMVKLTKIKNHTDFFIHLAIYSTIPGINANPTDDNLLLDYAESAFTPDGPMEMPHPEGISGGGIWYIPVVDDSQVWSPSRFPLCGILIKFDPTSREVIGLRMYHWLKLLSADHPELHRYLDPLINQKP
jgi:hypothetical protein